LRKNSRNGNFALPIRHLDGWQSMKVELILNLKTAKVLEADTTVSICDVSAYL